MTIASPLLRRVQAWPRRLAALVLLAMQAGVAASALVEFRSESRLSAHAEQDGTRHSGLHNEATCVLCAVRSLQAAAPLQTAHASAVGAHIGVTAGPTATAPRPESLRANLSRAPPTSRT